MFARATSLVVITLFLATSATATPTPATATDGSCDTSSISCCSQLQQAGAGGPITEILNLLGLNVAADVPVGFDCSPITVIGVGQSQCSESPVCCQNNNVGGLLSIGCVPVQV